MPDTNHYAKGTYSCFHSPEWPSWEQIAAHPAKRNIKNDRHNVESRKEVKKEEEKLKCIKT